MGKLVVLVAALGIITFLVVSATFSFRSNLFSRLFPKPSSLATTNLAKGIYDHPVLNLVSLTTVPNPPSDASVVTPIYETRLNSLKEAGFTDIYVWIVNRYIEAVLNPDTWGLNGADTAKKCPDYAFECQLATWDGVGVYIQKAKEKGFKVHVWYAPSEEKRTWSGFDTELISHPEWRSVYRDGTIHTRELDYAYDDMQAYEQDIILKLAERYQPDDIHLEETYYQTYTHRTYQDGTPVPYDDQELTYSLAFKDKFKSEYGYDLKPDQDFCTSNPASPGCVVCSSLAPSNPTGNDICQRRIDIHNLKVKLISNFYTNLRAKLKEEFPNITLSTTTGINAKSNWYGSEGMDVKYWFDNNLIDYAMPQIYTSSLTNFVSWTNKFVSDSGPNNTGKVIPIVWAPYNGAKTPPEQNPTWLYELAYLDKQGFAGNVFTYYLLRQEDLDSFSNRDEVSLLTGDLNFDNKVDIFDYNILIADFGKVGTNIPSDIDSSGKVDIFDYNLLLQNFGKSN